MNACEVKAHLIGSLAALGAPLFLAAYPSGLNLVVAVLRDSVCVIAALRGRLLSVVYIVCKVERFVSIILNEDY